MRTTLYAPVAPERREAAFGAMPLTIAENAGAGKFQRRKRPAPILLEPAQADRDDPLYEQVILMAACN